jgi:exopolysaccharide biosynthesis polyprenyl glycosylphosphotransferase
MPRVRATANERSAVPGRTSLDADEAVASQTVSSAVSAPELARAAETSPVVEVSATVGSSQVIDGDPVVSVSVSPASEPSLRSESGSLAVPPGFVRPRTRPGLLDQRGGTSQAVHRRARAGLKRRGDFTRMRVVLWIADTLIAALGIAVALVHHKSSLLVLVPLAWLFMIAVRASRDGRISDLNDLRPLVRASLNYVLVMMAVGAFADGDTRWTLGIAAGVATLGYVARRTIALPPARAALGLDVGESVVIVGDLQSVTRTISEWQELDLVNLVGVCLSEADFGPDEVLGVPVLGTVADVASLSRRTHIDVVAVHDVDRLGGRQLAKLQWALEDVGTQLSVITPITNTVVERARVRTLGRRVMVDLAYSRPQGIVAFTKHVIDRVLALVLILITTPILAVCAVLIKLSDPGPVIFKQTRVREHGRTFTMYKLRTMTVDAEARLAEIADLNEVGGGLFKIRADPRVTPVGRWLRRLSLDELPQLWNVVIGDMSLIGPRPALPHEVASYDESARRRLAVKPGLTGLWQVSGRSNLTWDESVLIDSDYVDNWRPGREVVIALRTVKAVLTKEGSY